MQLLPCGPMLRIADGVFPRMCQPQLVCMLLQLLDGLVQFHLLGDVSLALSIVCVELVNDDFECVCASTAVILQYVC